MAKVIGEGNYNNALEYNSNIKEVNELIISINKLAEKLNKQELLRKRLTTDISHELRTPITSMQGHLDAMIDGVWEITPQRLISIKEEVVRLGSLVGSLRNLAKFDNETSESNRKNTNLGELIQNIIYNYEAKALDKNISIDYELNNIYMNIDKNQFSQVIINLLSNAIKYTNKGGKIYIKLTLLK
ncbi:sensor histidine kinase [Romboutsia lituseburensis]|uniref:sensor histidine kinase n=1 Tax=Romboutsia lituseburensis TaxID=1537 RepID=UPI00215A8682|nr:histidine kinase dimerization/phospho-acceptor domain-containing protein [Romboutsia lituseburensis]MCR8744077.1 hypothetical protein [Romboutsia lituseburensis]